ncbi:MAG: CcmD family protein [Calditrichia bacterium]|nr:CcmD family protein [Calditrichia bacterium]
MLNMITLLNLPGDSTAMDMVPQEVAGADIYIVMAVTLIVWGGIFFYLLYLNGKLKTLRKKVDTIERK